MAYHKEKLEAGFGLLGLIFVIAIIGVLVGGGSYFKEVQQQKSLLNIGHDAQKKAEEVKKKIEAEQKKINEELNNNPGHICTQEAKQCPDGSYVSRTGPHCEFSDCPQNQKKINDTSNWETYRNEKYGFEVRYPLEFSVWEDEGSIRVGIPVTRGGFSDGRYDLYVSDIRMRGNLTREQFVHNNATYQPGNNQYQEEGSGVINEVKVYWYTLLLGSGNRKVYFFLKNDDSGIEMNYSGIFRGSDNPLSEKWEQIIFTFRFIK